MAKSCLRSAHCCKKALNLGRRNLKGRNFVFRYSVIWNHHFQVAGIHDYDMCYNKHVQPAKVCISVSCYKGLQGLYLDRSCATKMFTQLIMCDVRRKSFDVDGVRTFVCCCFSCRGAHYVFHHAQQPRTYLNCDVIMLSIRKTEKEPVRWQTLSIRYWSRW